MNKYTKIVHFDVGTERPTHLYVASLKATNAELLEALDDIAELAADKALSRVYILRNVLARATEATLKAKRE